MNNKLDKEYYGIGVMSGTSLDGVDIAFCHYFKQNEKWNYKLIHFHTYDYPSAIKSEIQKLTKNPSLPFEDFSITLGTVYSDLVLIFLAKFSIDISLVHFIACHGQTIYHNPAEKKTIQIGDGKTIAYRTNICTINDFRSLDVSLGGQGAPLVPIGDFHFFYDYALCVNLGGICNITIQNENEIVTAFDVCPCNLLLNYYANKLSLEFDKGGAIAKSGEINDALLKALNNHPYYKKQAPKSLDAQEVLRSFLPIINSHQIIEADVLHTLCVHIAVQLKNVIDAISFKNKTMKMLLAGGGALNLFLVKCIKEITKIEIVDLGKQEIEAKEAIIFGLLGVLKLENEVNCLKIVTGASADNCGGVIYYPE